VGEIPKTKENRGFSRKLVVRLSLLLFSFPAFAGECVNVKYRGAVPIESFECYEITDSSFVYRVCYDEPNQYLVIKLTEGEKWETVQ